MKIEKEDAIVMLFSLSIMGVWMTYNFGTIVSPILTTIFSCLVFILYFLNLREEDTNNGEGEK